MNPGNAHRYGQRMSTNCRPHTSVRIEGPDHEKKIMKATSAALAAAGLGIFVTEQQGTVSALSGGFQFIDQAPSTSTPVKIHSADRLTVDTGTGEATYTGTYR